MAAKPVRFGVVGAGYWGPNLIRNLTELPSAELVAVADLDEERLDRVSTRHPTVRTTTNASDLLDLGVDAVVIATPPATHYALGKMFLANGVHCLIEKPLATSVEAALELTALANRRGVQLMTGHTYLYASAVRELKRLIDNGDLGDVFYIDSVRTNLGVFQLKTDAMWDLAPHDISIVNYLLGSSPVSVTAHAGSFVMKSVGINDLVYLHLEYPSGRLANIRVSWLDPHKTRRTTVVGNKKMVVYDDVQTAEQLRIYDRGAVVNAIPESFGEFQFSYRHGDVVIPHLLMEEPLRVECREFVDAIRTGIPPYSDGNFGIGVVEALAAGQRSLKLARSVSLEEVRRDGMELQARTAVPSTSA